MPLLPPNAQHVVKHPLDAEYVVGAHAVAVQHVLQRRQLKASVATQAAEALHASTHHWRRDIRKRTSRWMRARSRRYLRALAAGCMRAQQRRRQRRARSRTACGGDSLASHRALRASKLLSTLATVMTADREHNDCAGHAADTQNSCSARNTHHCPAGGNSCTPVLYVLDCTCFKLRWNVPRGVGSVERMQQYRRMWRSRRAAGRGSRVHAHRHQHRARIGSSDGAGCGAGSQRKMPAAAAASVAAKELFRTRKA